MLILALESSAKAASAALVRDGETLGAYFQNCGLTHSRTLLPMAETLLANTDTALSAVDAVAVARGPGSFTGIRIGVAAAKGLAWGAEKPLCGVSTLEAIAWNGYCAPEGAVLCAAMDARRSQVYNALFRWQDGAPVRLTEDRAISLEELAAELKAYQTPIFTLGDGAVLCYNDLRARGFTALLAAEHARYQSAWGVAMAAMGMTPEPAGAVNPVYLRLSQAERERLEREAGEKNGN